jgi:hypothetical protein
MIGLSFFTEGINKGQGYVAMTMGMGEEHALRV